MCHCYFFWGIPSNSPVAIELFPSTPLLLLCVFLLNEIVLLLLFPCNPILFLFNYRCDSPALLFYFLDWRKKSHLAGALKYQTDLIVFLFNLCFYAGWIFDINPLFDGIAFQKSVYCNA